MLEEININEIPSKLFVDIKMPQNLLINFNIYYYNQFEKPLKTLRVICKNCHVMQETDYLQFKSISNKNKNSPSYVLIFIYLCLYLDTFSY